MAEGKGKSAFVLAAANSGAGKTTMALALMAALPGTVQPYKVGPDYIDPMYHRAATGRHSRNLDGFMLDEETMAYLFRRQMASADIGIVEGVMGLYDGVGKNSLTASTARTAQILDLPVVLLLNPQGMSLTMAALVKGLMDFSPRTRFAGVILNDVKSEGLFLYAKEIIESVCHVPVFGYLPRLESARFDSRHLGLVCSGEIGDMREKIAILAQTAKKTIDLAALCRATAYRDRKANPPRLPEALAQSVRIGVAQDSAFNFYYQDALDLIGELGGEIQPVSPLADPSLPELDGLILGGGYPELHAGALAANGSFQKRLRLSLADGLPCHAECGGFLYLGKSLTYRGESHEMTGFFPFDFVMSDRLQRFGYLEATLLVDTVLGPAGEKIRGHEFHFTKMSEEVEGGCFSLRKPGRAGEWRDGHLLNRTVAAYPHFHLWSRPGMAKAFLEQAASYRERRRKS